MRLVKQSGLNSFAPKASPIHLSVSLPPVSHLLARLWPCCSPHCPSGLPSKLLSQGFCAHISLLARMPTVQTAVCFCPSLCSCHCAKVSSAEKPSWPPYIKQHASPCIMLQTAQLLSFMEIILDQNLLFTCLLSLFPHRQKLQELELGCLPITETNA